MTETYDGDAETPARPLARPASAISVAAGSGLRLRAELGRCLSTCRGSLHVKVYKHKDPGLPRGPGRRSVATCAALHPAPGVWKPGFRAQVEFV